MIEISSPEVNEGICGKKRISAKLDGEEIWLEMPADLAPEPRGELFLALGLFLAVHRSEDLAIDAALPLCPKLYAQLPYILKILKQWNPEFRLPRIEAKTRSVSPRPGMVISSFSGGVDSSFTFSRHRDKITHLLVTNCFDEDGKPEPFAALAEKIGRFAEAQGKRLLPIETNTREVADKQNMSFDYLHGPFLCTVATAFGADQYYIPSSNTTRALKPWGSHPFLDPLWATNVTNIDHDGLDTARTERTCAIAADPELLNNLQVCWNSKISNCGKCSKCTRTLLVLRELGIEGGPFPAENPMENLNRMKLSSDQAASHVWDLMWFFKERGKTDIADKLRQRIDAYLLKRSREAFFKALIGPRGQALFHRLRGTKWRDRRIILRDPDNFE